MQPGFGRLAAMKRALTLLASLCALHAAPAAAQNVTVVEEWVTVEATASRYVSPLQARTERAAIAAFGPFRVIDAQTAALVGITDARSPAWFDAMMAAHPHIALLEFVEAPGTHDDRANLALGRTIRAHGIATRVARGGSVRSGAVELFLAGVSREIAPGSEFAVHGWLDDWGRGAQDYPAGAPEHLRYLRYYEEMGMAREQARAFYAMTNSVPFEQALWLTGNEMREWLGQAAPSGKAAEANPPLAQLDFEPVLQ